jgi:hypothetical protein
MGTPRKCSFRMTIEVPQAIIITINSLGACRVVDRVLKLGSSEGIDRMRGGRFG